MARPQITLKIASSLDGKIALANGQSEWITGEAAREHGRRLRGTHDAIAVGSNTAYLDNPQLTTRISGLADPIRIIFDTNARLPLSSNLAQSAKDIPVWLMTAASDEAVAALSGAGVKIFQAGTSPADTGEAARVDIARALELIHRQSIRSLLLEGGGKLAASFLKADFIDVIEWYRAPMILGADGRSAIGALGLEEMGSSFRFNRVSLSELGSDIYERYERIRH